METKDIILKLRTKNGMSQDELTLECWTLDSYM